MFDKRRKNAIKLLNNQLSKIGALTVLDYDSWKSYTDAIIKQYIDDKFITESQIMGRKFELDYDEAEKISPKKAAKDWLMMKQFLAKDYVTRYINYLEEGGKLIYEPNWFQQKKTGELLTMINIFIAILLSGLLPYTCNQGKIQGAADAKDQIGKLKHERDSLRTELINCISNLPKPDNSPKDNGTQDKN